MAVYQLQFMEVHLILIPMRAARIRTFCNRLVVIDQCNLHVRFNSDNDCALLKWVCSSYSMLSAVVSWTALHPSAGVQRYKGYSAEFKLPKGYSAEFKSPVLEAVGRQQTQQAWVCPKLSSRQKGQRAGSTQVRRLHWALSQRWDNVVWFFFVYVY